MEQIAQQLVGQIVEEKQVYLDNARLKHGVPRHAGSRATGVAMSSQTDSTDPSTGASPAGDSSVTVAPKQLGRSLLKTAATLGLAAAAGAVGIPPIVTSIAGNWFSKAVEPSPPAPGPPVDRTAEEWNDLVNWIRDEKLNK